MSTAKRVRAPQSKAAPAPEAPWTVYVLRCDGGTLYTGITNHLPERLEAHRSGRGARYTRGRLPVEVAHQEGAASRGDALRREREIKGLTRKAKLALIGGGASATNESVRDAGTAPKKRRGVLQPSVRASRNSAP